MFLQVHKQLFEEFRKRTIEKLSLLWPSKRNTPPTEENITLNIAEVGCNFGYHSYAQFPLIQTKALDKPGPIDLVLLNHDRTEVLFVEVKTGQSGFEADIHNDFRKLAVISPQMFLAGKISHQTMSSVQVAYGLHAVWTENPQKGKHFLMLTDPMTKASSSFEEDVCNSDIKDAFKITISDATLYFLYFGRPLHWSH